VDVGSKLKRIAYRLTRSPQMNVVSCHSISDLSSPDVKLVAVCGRNYRAQVCEEEPLEQEERFQDAHEAWDGDESKCQASGTPMLVDHEDGIDEAPNGSYSCRMEAPADLHSSVIGKGRAMLHKLEREAAVSITVPRKGAGVHEITIEGASQEGVASARSRIMILLSQARRRCEYNYFLNIPLCNTSAKAVERLDSLSSSIIQQYGDRILTSDMFVKPVRLHLTLAMLKLLTPAECSRAIGILQETPLPQAAELKLQGLEYMNDDPSSVDVLYLKVGGAGTRCVHEAAETLIRRLEEEGLLDAEEIAKQRLFKENGQSNIKLHATLINSKYRKGQSEKPVKGGKGGKGQPDRVPFDAEGILATFGDWAGFQQSDALVTETPLTLAISHLAGSAPNGGYKPLATRSFQ